MRNLLYPGMLLISRLGFANKFTLISLLFFVPLVWLSYSVIDEAYDKIQITKSQRQGLELIEQVNITIQAAERFRDMRLVAAYQMQDTYSAKANEYQNRFQHELNTLKNQKSRFSDSRLSGNETYMKVLSDFERSEKTIRNLSVSNEASMEATFNVLNGMVVNGNTLLKTIIELSGLSRDSNPETKSLLDFATRDLAPFNIMLGKIRGIGAYSLTQNYLNSATANEMDDITAKLYEAQQQLNKNLGLMIPSRYNQIREQGQSLSKQITEVLDNVDSQIITAMSFTKPWESFFAEVSGVIDFQHTLKKALYKTIDQHLVERLDEQSNKLNLISIAIIAVMLLIIYLYSAFYLSLRTSIDKLVEATDKLAEGDMTVQMSVATQDELGYLTERFNQTADQIRKLIQQVHTTSDEVHHQSNEVSRISEVTSEAIHHQMRDTEQAATAMTQMSSNFNEVAAFSGQAEGAAQEASVEANRGRNRVKQTLQDINNLATEIQNSAEVVDQLATDSANISQVLVQIKGIAEQTNLLALNAAIEAARAGDHGRGFAVVADEVRSLSARTHESTEEIEEMIQKIHNGVDNAVTAMANSHKMASTTVSESQEVGEALEAIHEKVTTIVEMNTHIAEAVKQQALTAEDIDRNIVDISRIADENVKNAEETTTACQEMGAKANQLQEMLTSFKV